MVFTNLLKFLAFADFLLQMPALVVEVLQAELLAVHLQFSVGRRLFRVTRVVVGMTIKGFKSDKEVVALCKQVGKGALKVGWRLLNGWANCELS